MVVYLGDVFEEELNQAVKAAKALRLKGCRTIILHDTADPLAHKNWSAFSAIADAGGGCVLPFDLGSLPRLRERQKALPAAMLLLGYLGKSG